MSMLLYEAETPCPPRSNSSRLEQTNNGSDVFDSLGGDEFDHFEDTANIDFTTEIRAPVLTAKPRRGNRAASTFHVHDENEGDIAPAAVKRRRENVMVTGPKNRKSSLLSQPAQRFRPKVNFAPSPPKPQRQSVKPGPIAARESSPEANKSLLSQINEHGQQRQGKDTLKKDVRRGTIYIPQDDTTVASAFMGLFSPVKSQDPNGAKSQFCDDTQFNSLEARIAAKRQAKMCATSSKRAPLQPSLKAAPDANVRVDIPGKNGGKENIPPGTIRVDGKGKGLTKDLPSHDSKPDNAALRNASIQSKATAGPNATRASGTGNKNSTTRKTNIAPQKRAVLGEKQCNTNASTLDYNQKKDSLKHRPTPEKNQFAFKGSASRAAKPPMTNLATSKPPMADLKLKNLNTEYPLLTENISNTAMYEDNWLSHQEIVITQLVNGLFDYTDGSPGPDDPEILRYELLEHYQSKPLALLHKRLQASLLYGALSVPQFFLARARGIQQDLGFKRKFVNFWTQTYDPRALRAAMETVVGRRVMNDQQDFQSSPESSPKGTGTGNKVLRRKLGQFVEVFLLRNEDMDQYATDNETKKADPASRSYRRTVLRSIMIVALLDQGKASHGTMLPRLFTPSSPFKSSTAVLQALGRILLPSTGDINKPLSHLDCRMSYKQRELQDFDYQISNLAVDLRDGVRLTRIVELLLYLPSSCLSVVEPDSDCSTTVPLPDGELLSLSGNDGSCPLSQHLKFPCASRAVKLFNLRIALGALASTDSTRAIVNDVQAEDIVDGHREKTIALLWGLVSKWGLAGLVDWDDVRKEVERLKQKAMSRFGSEHVDQDWLGDEDHDGSSHGGYALLLKRWAAVLAELKGLRLENLSTNFADGKIYESIVDEYEGYILGKTVQPNAGQHNLYSRLQKLGCSSQFAHLVSPGSSKTHILDSDFTLASLAFLCSRLLSASKRARAAAVLQRAWRQILARRNFHRRTVARNIAMQCAAVVQEKDRIICAQEIIAKWWRVVRARRHRQKPVLGAGHRTSKQALLSKR